MMILSMLTIAVMSQVACNNDGTQDQLHELTQELRQQQESLDEIVQSRNEQAQLLNETSQSLRAKETELSDARREYDDILAGLQRAKQYYEAYSYGDSPGAERGRDRESFVQEIRGLESQLAESRQRYSQIADEIKTLRDSFVGLRDAVARLNGEANALVNQIRSTQAAFQKATHEAASAADTTGACVYLLSPPDMYNCHELTCSECQRRHGREWHPGEACPDHRGEGDRW